MAVTVVRRPNTTTRMNLWGPWIAGLSYWLVAAYFNRDAITSDLTEDGDYAADALRAMSPVIQVDGIFSRWDFHHPGPVLFWLKWVGLQFGELPGISPFGGQILVCLAVPALAVGVLGWLCWRVTGSGWGYVFAVVVTLLTSSGQLAPWGPSVATWMAMLGVVAIAAMTLDSPWAAPVAVFAGMSMVHLHIVFVPAGVATLVAVSWLGRRRRLSLRPAFLVAVVMSVPLLVDLGTGGSDWTAYATGTPDGLGLAWKPLARGLGWSMSPFDAFSDLAFALGVLTILGTALAGLLFLRSHPAAPLAVCVTGGLALLGFVILTSPFATSTSRVGGGPVPLVLVPVLASWATRGMSARISTAAFGIAFSVVAVTHHSASVAPGSGLAETALTRVGPVDVLVVDHMAADTMTYPAAAALRLLAERSGIEACSLLDRWPHWTDSTCTIGQTDRGTVVMFTAADAFTIDP